jgi:hypothetical protein
MEAHTARIARHSRGWTVAATLIGALVGALALGACGSISTGTSSTTTTAPTTARAAVVVFLNDQGVEPTKYTITRASAAKANPAWAYFQVGPVRTDRDTFQAFYGFAHKTGGQWKVVGSGSSEVGCPPGAPGNALVPAAVLAEFGLVCPTTTTAAATTTTSTTPTSAPQSDLTAAVVAFQTSQGIARSRYQINRLTVSTVQPTWAIFAVGPTTVTKATFQGGYGFLHLVNGSWVVVGFGSAEVGCPPGVAGNMVVPTAVISGFGQSCPTTSTTTTSKKPSG